MSRPAWLRRLSFALLLPPLAALGLAACGRDSGPPNLPDLVETLAPMVVNISAAPSGETGESADTLSLGSGFVWQADGHVLTNAHVVAPATHGVTVKLHDRHEYPAQLIATDPATDLALLKIDAPGLTAVSVADPAQLRVGMPVVALGAPYGFEQTVTTGILSAKARSLAGDPYVPYLQTDAAISPGSSGGPLFDAFGRIVGINTQMLADRQGMGTGTALAIPIDVAVRVAEALRDEGVVRRAWLGLNVESIDATDAAALGLDAVSGARITEVSAASPAAESGLRVGDVVLSIEGQPLSGASALPLLISQLAPGAMATLDLIRDGRTVQIKAELGEIEPDAARTTSTRPPPSLWGMPDAPPPGTSAPRESEGAQRGEPTGDNPLGLRVAALDAEQRSSIPLMSGGVRIVRVDGASAVRAGLRVDDLLLQVNGQAVNSPERFVEVVSRLTPEASVPLLVQRRGSPLFLTLEMPRRP